MPRRSRKRIESGVYHIMLRGNERKDIFLDEEYKQKIIEILTKARKNDSFKVYAYCVMDNHLHIVIKERDDSISRILKQIATSYAYYYNKKHCRVGHVFQDRFKSEGIKDDGQLLEVIRYVHNNPVKAGIVRRVGDYKWSSYRFYNTKTEFCGNNTVFCTDCEEILKMFSEDIEKAEKLFAAFSKERTEEKFLDDDYMELEQDRTLLENLIKELLMIKGVVLEDVKTDKKLMEWMIRELKFRQGVPGRKVARLLGINRNVVQRIGNRESNENRP